jgi:hypothetical protein
MAVLTAQRISRLMVALLNRQLVLPRTVSMIPGEEFSGSNGDTITVRVRQPRAARTQASAGTPLVANSADEVPVELQVSHLYDLHNLSDQQATLELEDFAAQVSVPQMQAVAIGAEAQITTVMNGLTDDVTIDSDGSDIEDVILQARRDLSRNDVPAENRWFACSPEVLNFVLAIDKFVRVDASGSDQALREAGAGRLYGFTFVETRGLDAGEAVAYHQSGFAFATRPPATPRGATDSANTNEQGIALRTVFQYDASTAQDQVLVSTFAGASAVYEDSSGTDSRRFVKLRTSGT